MSKMTDRQKVQFLRQFCKMGHTDGTPIESSCFTIYTGRPSDLISYKEVKGLIDELMIKIALGDMTLTDKFVIQMLKDNGILQGFVMLEEEMAKL